MFFFSAIVSLFIWRGRVNNLTECIRMFISCANGAFSFPYSQCRQPRPLRGHPNLHFVPLHRRHLPLLIMPLHQGKHPKDNILLFTFLLTHITCLLTFLLISLYFSSYPLYLSSYFSCYSLYLSSYFSLSVFSFLLTHFTCLITSLYFYTLFVLPTLLVFLLSSLLLFTFPLSSLYCPHYFSLLSPLIFFTYPLTSLFIPNYFSYFPLTSLYFSPYFSLLPPLNLFTFLINSLNFSLTSLYFSHLLFYRDNVLGKSVRFLSIETVISQFCHNGQKCKAKFI